MGERMAIGLYEIPIEVLCLVRGWVLFFAIFQFLGMMFVLSVV